MRLQTKSSKTDPKPSAPISAPGRWPLTHARGPVRPSLRAGLVAGAAFAVVIAVAAGFASARPTTPERAAPGAGAADRTAGPVTMTSTATGCRRAPCRACAGLTRTPPRRSRRPPACARTPSRRSAPIGDPSLLPAPLRALMPGRAAEAEGDRAARAARRGTTASRPIAGGRRWRSRSCRPRPACWPSPASRRASRGWPRSAAPSGIQPALAARRARWLEPGADVAAQARLPARSPPSSTRRRVALREQLEAAKTRGGQARFAGRLSRAYAAAAAALAPVAPAKGPRRRSIALAAQVRGRYRGSPRRGRRRVAEALPDAPSKSRQAQRRGAQARARRRASLITARGGPPARGRA